ncbi:MAG: T9SS type A sorting domain-containing protein [Flavobacterium sp.]|nr:T9SS type A sorting domain-containing protein [Flavobacterium sp.]
MKTIVLLFITFSGYSQILHHQMFSSQGETARTSSGVVIRQTIGQQSVIGNHKNSNFIVGQGFQQSNKMKSSSPSITVIKVIAYPNPFVERVNFKFSNSVEGPVKITIYDIVGRLVFTDEKPLINNTVSYDNLFFAEGEYFAKLTANNFTYSTNLLKRK